MKCETFILDSGSKLLLDIKKLSVIQKHANMSLFSSYLKMKNITYLKSQGWSHKKIRYCTKLATEQLANRCFQKYLL